MFGRPSLRELFRSQHKEFMSCHREAMDRQEDQHKTVMQRLEVQHDEFMRYQEKRDEYEKKRDDEFLIRTEEFREFNREVLLRNEKIYTGLIAEMEEGRKQLQANTKAVLSVLDRLEGLGGATAA